MMSGGRGGVCGGRCVGGRSAQPALVPSERRSRALQAPPLTFRVEPQQQALLRQRGVLVLRAGRAGRPRLARGRALRPHVAERGEGGGGRVVALLPPLVAAPPARSGDWCAAAAGRALSSGRSAASCSVVFSLGGRCRRAGGRTKFWWWWWWWCSPRARAGCTFGQWGGGQSTGKQESSGLWRAGNETFAASLGPPATGRGGRQGGPRGDDATAAAAGRRAPRAR